MNRYIELLLLTRLRIRNEGGPDSEGRKKTYNTLRGVSVEAGSPLTIDRACEARNAGSAA